MKVSIITASLNAEGTIREAAESLFVQTYPQIQYIIKDGGSTDKTVEIVSSFGKKVDRLITGPDRGIYDAINQGILASDGEIVGLLHADDLLAAPTVIEKVVHTFEKEKCHAVYGDLDYVKREHPEKVLRRWRSGSFDPALVRRGWMPPHPSLFIKRALFDTCGPYNTEYHIAADYDFMLRLLTDPHLVISYLPEVLVHMRTGGISNRNLSRIIQKSGEDLRIIRSHKLPVPLFVLLNKNFTKISQFFGS